MTHREADIKIAPLHYHGRNAGTEIPSFERVGFEGDDGISNDGCYSTHLIRGHREEPICDAFSVDFSDLGMECNRNSSCFFERFSTTKKTFRIG
ncbi:MAG: hypothetical protein CVU06_12840 [Bacteroidetes bacterium HGW-Bacteroidetes-22]|nr:MAG: hypothetical protein CVU06_12840 [Bacteroidetes bacterium HGW-Bacteroidetes-22]